MSEKAQPAANAPAVRPPAAIFVNYRRDDCGHAAQHLAEDLQRRFGKHQVFFDSRTIAPGAVWPAEIRAALQAARVVIACFGPEWHLQHNPETGDNRLDEPDDWVREELATAGRLATPAANGGDGLVRTHRVLPVLLASRSEMPKAAIARRTDLAYLNSLNAIPLRAGSERDAGLAALVAAIVERGVPELPAEQRAPVAPGELLVRYRDAMVAMHSKLVPFHPELQDRLLADVCVQVDVAWEDLERQPTTAKRERRAPAKLHADCRRVGLLRDVLLGGEGDDDGERLRHLVVQGEPGAGKSTLARNFVRQLAADPQAPVPLFVPLGLLDPADVRGGSLDVFAWASKQVLGDDLAAQKELAQCLRNEAFAGRAVLVFDGLDETAPELVKTVTTTIAVLASDVKSPVVVLARPIAVEKSHLPSSFTLAKVQALAVDQRDRLVGLLLSPDAATHFLNELRANASLADLCRNPLLLTLAAMVSLEAMAERRAIPAWRHQIYEQAIELLLKRGYGAIETAKGVRDPFVARGALAVLSLHLHGTGREVWTEEQLQEATWQMREQPDGAKWGKRIDAAWGSHAAFVEDIGANAGVLGPHDGRQGWRFLHRSLREYLAAACLKELGPAAWQPRIEAWQKEEKRASEEQGRDRVQWAEVFALLGALVDEPRSVLEAIRAVSPKLARRALFGVDGIEPAVGFVFALAAPDVEAPWFVRLAQRWQVDANEAERILMAHVTPAASTAALAAIYFALEQWGRPAEAGTFFERAGRARRAMAIDWVAVPAGRFVMGSPESEAERESDEGPQRSVEIRRAFALARHCVTNAQYQDFDPRHEPWRWETKTRGGRVQGMKDAELAAHPVVNVSWWEAKLYCVWLGGRLPTEAEWEYVCRAGTTTPFSFGANITTEQVNYVGGFPHANGEEGEYQAPTVPVGSLPANAWGLHEMHGNVWEWCEDWHGAYEKAPSDGSAQQTDDGSGRRVLRGGSWFDNAWGCRSAYRHGGLPGLRHGNVGFRPASSLP